MDDDSKKLKNDRDEASSAALGFSAFSGIMANTVYARHHQSPIMKASLTAEIQMKTQQCKTENAKEVLQDANAQIQTLIESGHEGEHNMALPFNTYVQNLECAQKTVQEQPVAQNQHEIFGVQLNSNDLVCGSASLAFGLAAAYLWKKSYSAHASLKGAMKTPPQEQSISAPQA